MSGRRGPLSGGQVIATLELLEAVDQWGPTWPSVLSAYTLEAVSTAVGREIVAGNLADGAHLSDQGRATLAQLRASPPREPRAAAADR